MLRSSSRLRWLALAFAAIHVGCTSESKTTPDEGAPTDHPDAGTNLPSRPPPVFVDSAQYEDLVTIDPAFPFGVTQVHRADAQIAGSHWGRHGGPMVTSGVYGSEDEPSVIHWTVDDDPTSPATRKALPLGQASGLPASYFYGADGMVDLPFGSLSLLSYTGSGEPYAGEALLYTADYTHVASRAKVNGFYSGTAIEAADGTALVYSGLSPLSKSDSTANESGLYAALVCDGELLSTSCAEPWKLFGWKGQSGPVVTDLHGNVFVGASLTSGATSDAVYAVTTAQVVPGSAAKPATVAAIDSKGTSSLAAVAPEADSPGWVLGLGYDDKSAVYAASYVEKDGAVSKSDSVVESAITRASDVTGLSVFTDADGDLWLAVAKAASGTYLELRRKVQ